MTSGNPPPTQADKQTDPPAPPQSFAALRHPGYRAFFFSMAAAMMADSVEHVISYWVIFQKFHSTALAASASAPPGIWLAMPAIVPVLSAVPMAAWLQPTPVR